MKTENQFRSLVARVYQGKWWKHLPEADRQIVKDLVESGHLEKEQEPSGLVGKATD